jgi:hypothetical protein
MELDLPTDGGTVAREVIGPETWAELMGMAHTTLATAPSGSPDSRNASSSPKVAQAVARFVDYRRSLRRCVDW